MKLTRREAAASLAGIAGLGPLSAQSSGGAKSKEGHGVWCSPRDAGMTHETAVEFVSRCQRAGIDAIVMCAKETNGDIYWHSKRFPQAVAERYREFDVLRHVLDEAHNRGMQVHMWVCDYVEGTNSAAVREHPDWAQLNVDGTNTSSETLFNRKYTTVGMCPARRPGYTDQWLLPMIEELTSTYPVDGIHHDYVRYTGDVAPDSYCFCDYCLEHLPRWALLQWESGPRERTHVEIVRPRVEANWEATPDMLPGDWAQRTRREKADYIQNGRTIAGGPADMRYFFYEYRVDQITSFVREACRRVKQINPKVQMSAAVFKNPIQSARYIGQKWSDWTQFVDVFMPMSYRSHFLGSFDTYCEHLAEITSRQMEWIRREKPLWAGIFTSDLYREERTANDSGRPAAKLTRAIEAARKANPGGIVIFSAGSLTRDNLWPALESSLKV